MRCSSGGKTSSRLGELPVSKRLTADADIHCRFAAQVPQTVLLHHRCKLFPASTSSDALLLRTEPEPSPFKTRSLLSLDKSARRKETKAGVHLIAQSPTMRRLIGKSRRIDDRIGMGTVPTGSDNVFKVPALPKNSQDRTTAVHGTVAEASALRVLHGQSRTKAPRKQPRPLPRGDSLATSSKSLFSKRREVSLPRRSGGVGLKRKPSQDQARHVPAAPANHRSRKNPSPKSEESIVL